MSAWENGKHDKIHGSHFLEKSFRFVENHIKLYRAVQVRAFHIRAFQLRAFQGRAFQVRALTS